MKEKYSNEDYLNYLASSLKIPEKRTPVVLDLFAGAGGLALGFESCGFETIGIEKEPVFVETYNANLKGRCIQAYITPEFDFPKADIIIGGPPCQPFSVGGLQLGLKDSRDGFPAFIAAVEKLNPQIWLFENVRGLLYKNKWYLEEILDKLESLGYTVEEPRLLNTSNYGVPQNRERLIIIGHRGTFKFPEPDGRKFTAGEALGSHVLEAPEESKFLNASMDEYVAKYERASKCINPRDLHLDKPARTLTCRNLAGATGDMQRIKLPDGRRRRLFTHEAALLQSFPENFKFAGSETDIFNQIGNAVPPLFGRYLAKAIREYISSPQPICRIRTGRIKQQRLQLHEEV